MEVINMEKGQRIDLTKTMPGLKKVGCGLGWDVKTGSGDAFDLDSFVVLLNNGKMSSAKSGLVFFNNRDADGVQHQGDNLTGAGDGDDEVIHVDLDKVKADEILIGVNIYQSAQRNQKFGQVNNAFVRLYNRETNEELCKFDLTEDKSTGTGMILGKLYKKDGEWKFQAVGEEKNGEINEIAKPYLN